MASAITRENPRLRMTTPSVAEPYGVRNTGGCVLRADAQILRGRLDLRPRLVLDGNAVAAALGLEPRLRLAGDEDLRRALRERCRLHPLEQRAHLLVEVGGRQESREVEADHQRAVGEDALAGASGPCARH